MQLTFWGVRGSIPTPGKDTVRYGGNTPCIELNTDTGDLIILDCGSGFRTLGLDLMKRKDPSKLKGKIFITHTHWDHIQGIPFFTPFFIAGSQWEIYAPKGFSSNIQNILAGQMQSTYFPVKLEDFQANIDFYELVEGSLSFKNFSLKTHYLNHPALTLGYRVEADGATVVYASDHEPYTDEFLDAKDLHPKEKSYRAFLENSDLVIHDSPYTSDEYPQRKNWGHSTFDYALHSCLKANVQKLAFFHHDPTRTDDQLDSIVSFFQKKILDEKLPIQAFAAQEGAKIALDGKKEAKKTLQEQTALESQAFKEKSILFLHHQKTLPASIQEIFQESELKFYIKSTVDEGIECIKEKSVSLIVIDFEKEPLKIVQDLQRSLSLEQIPLVPPLVLLSNTLPDAKVLQEHKIQDCITRPFSALFLKARLQSWIYQKTCHWQRASIPEDEEKRLQYLKEQKLLDVPAEKRFDQISEAAASYFQTPIALISLIDKERQYFRSKVGVDAKETPRDAAFCAHLLVNHQALIVNDTLLDPNFKENPLVTGDPRIRFYAGMPLLLKNGLCLGSFCVIDTKPRQFNEEELEKLKEFADKAIVELEKGTNK